MITAQLSQVRTGPLNQIVHVRIPLDKDAVVATLKSIAAYTDKRGCYTYNRYRGAENMTDVECERQR